MDEASITQECATATKEILRPCKWIKISDRATSGIPDVVVAALGRTNFFELKFLRDREYLRSIVRIDQLIFAHELWETNAGRSFFVVYENTQVTIWQPRALFQHLNGKLPVLTSEDSKATYGKPHACLDFDTTVKNNIRGVLDTFGALRIKGKRYDVIPLLCKHFKDYELPL